MARCVWPIAALAALLLPLAGCGVLPRAERPAWRGQAENACLAQGRVQASAFVQPAHPIDGPGICGLEHPFRVTALSGGAVTLNAPQTIGCPLTAALDDWVAKSVQPAAMARFGQPVVKISAMDAFSCRSIDNIQGAKLSEHSFGNAIDIGGFTLADGHSVVVVKSWNGADPQERAFLREVQAGACEIFTTVLAPGADVFHYNHIHLDLAMHGRTSSGPRRYCKPKPVPQSTPVAVPGDGLPNPPPIDEDLDVSQAGPPRPVGFAGGLNVAAPRQPVARAPAHYDENGAFVPAGQPDDPDATSAIGARPR